MSTGDYKIPGPKALHDRQPTACDTDMEKLALLEDAVHDAIDEGVEPDVFEIAVAIRSALPNGLEADDFDGVNIATILEV